MSEPQWCKKKQMKTECSRNNHLKLVLCYMTDCVMVYFRLCVRLTVNTPHTTAPATLLFCWIIQFSDPAGGGVFVRLCLCTDSSPLSVCSTCAPSSLHLHSLSPPPPTLTQPLPMCHPDEMNMHGIEMRVIWALFAIAGHAGHCCHGEEHFMWIDPSNELANTYL